MVLRGGFHDGDDTESFVVVLVVVFGGACGSFCGDACGGWCWLLVAMLVVDGDGFGDD